MTNVQIDKYIWCNHRYMWCLRLQLRWCLGNHSLQ